MQEIIEQLIIYLRDIWRYRWLALLLTCCFIIAGWVIFSKQTIAYTARANIYVDNSTVLEPLLEGLAVEKDPSVYLGIMTRELVSRPILQQVAEQIGFNNQSKTPRKVESFLAGMEHSIDVDAKYTNRNNAPDFYTISYSSADPVLAKLVVSTLIDTFVENVVAAGVRDSEAAKQFLQQQINKQQEAMQLAETQIAKFKSTHIGELPEEGVNYFQRLQAAQSALDDVRLQIIETQNRRQELQRQLNSTPALQPVNSDNRQPFFSPDHQRLLEAQRRLDELLLKYTDKHPDVIAARRSVTGLEAQVRTEQKPTEPNPVYQQLQLSLSGINSEMAALNARRATYEQRVELLQTQIDTLTDVEAELQRLQQNYARTKQQYETFIQRQTTAVLAENIEQAGEDVRFRIIDPPRIIDNTNSILSKQMVLTSGILLAGLGAGIAIAFGLGQVWPVAYRSNAIYEINGFPVIGTVSQTITPRVRLKKRLEVTALASILLCIFAVHSFAVWQHLSSINSAIQSARNIG